MLELYGDKHNVRTFVSLSSPQGGQYGGMCFFYLILLYCFLTCLSNIYHYVFNIIFTNKVNSVNINCSCDHATSYVISIDKYL